MSDTIFLDSHALLTHKLTQLRHKDCPPELFRSRMREIGRIMGCIIGDRLTVEDFSIETPLEKMTGKRLSHHPVIVPILRAGLGLADGVADVLVEADFAHIGVARNEETLQPEEYLVKIPKDLTHRDVIVVDPMLATGGSAKFTINMLKSRGAVEERIQFACLVASPEGSKILRDTFSGITIIAGALDRELNDVGYILPGLGDAGDRLYGTE